MPVANFSTEISMTCTPGDDSHCVNSFGQNNCCMNMTILSQAPDLDEKQQKKLDIFGSFGYSIEVGKSNHYCQDRHALTILINGAEDNQFQYQGVPLTIEAYCNGALYFKHILVPAMLSLFMAIMSAGY